MKGLKTIAVLGGLGIIGYALYRYYKIQAKFLEDITYKVLGVRVAKISASAITLDITARIYNASNVEAVVKEMYLDLLVNEVKVGNVNEIKDIPILPQKSSDISFSITFNPQLIKKNVVDLITFTIAAKDMKYDLRGYVKVKSGFLTTSLPFSYSNNLKSVIK
jgi:LEA14-like dessication related protein